MTDEVALEEAPIEEVAQEETQEAPQEKLIPASRVEELIKKAKLKGRDAMQDELEALRAENEGLKNGGSLGGMAAPVDMEALKKDMYAGFQQQLQDKQEADAQEQLRKEAEQMASEYHGKMEKGSELFDDFSEITADFNPSAFPNLVYLANQTDNTPAVIYELMKNPSKLAMVSVLSEKDPNAALNQINKLSASIKANEQAKAQEQEAPAPIGRMQSSPTGRDTGDTSIADFKRMFRG